jgi:hypothetical protein
MAVLIYIPTNNMQVVPFSVSLAALVNFGLFDISYSYQCEVTCHCCSDMNSNDY